MISIDKLRKILADIRTTKIAVIGDFCLDAYWFVDESMSEISIETGQSTRPVSMQRYSPGGAGNVTNNLAALRVGDVRAFGVIGSDPFGAEMVRIMKNADINTENLVTQTKEWDTHTYSKPYIGDVELNRIDFGNFNRLSDSTADRLIGNLRESIPDCDVIILNQQVPSGIHSAYFREQLLKVIKSFPEKIFITDSRVYNDFFTGTIRKMNDTEALRLCGHIRKPDDSISLPELEPAARELYKRFNKPLLITRGSKGSITIDNEGITEIPGLLILSRTDSVGAGDSYLAGAASTLAAGYTLTEAAELGTLVAGVTVQKLFQTGTASPEEILAIGNDPDFVYSPDLAEGLRHAHYHEQTEIEIITNRNNPEIEYAIFDHDGTISTLREGWEGIMAPMMMKAILGENYDTISDSKFHELSKRVDEFIDKTTGIQTLVQMNGLVDLVREFGFVPEEKILDPKGYKKIYNDELLKMVNLREHKFQRDELSIRELTIKDSVKFLRYLYDKGIKLYLASGTDIEDVIAEAKTLGYDTLFEGRIFGSVGDVAKEAKKIVLDQILDSIGAGASGKVVTFGDGPVEIRETKKKGGLTVGVASDELRRFGLNEKKRERLIKAGADIIIPDFSQYHKMARLLNL